MRRQAIRRALILISFLFFPITLYFLSPVVSLQAASEGILSGSLILFGLQFLSALVLGRAFCGWACPAAGLTEAFIPANQRPLGGRINWIKYFIWIPWLGLLAWLAITAGGFRAVNPTYQVPWGISIADPPSMIAYFAVLMLVSTLSLTFGKRAFCHAVCWMAPFMVVGTWLRDWLRIPGLRLASQTSSCTQCHTCNKVCPMSLDVSGKVPKGSMRDSECILCGSCVDNCPRHVIRFAWQERKCDPRST